MVLIWGANYSVIKHAFDEVPPEAFNALRISLASAIFLVAIWWSRRRGTRARTGLASVFATPDRLTVRDRLELLWLGIVGHFLYQWCFVKGVAGTTVSNAALIIGTTPALVAVLSAALGRERITRVHWLGAAVSAVGIYFAVGSGAAFDRASLRGDFMVAISVACWAIYTLGSSRLVTRYSPLYVTGTTMSIGGLLYAAVMLPQVVREDWVHVSAAAWAALVLSAILALCLAYLIWYAAVQRIGAARTAIYSNLVPIVAMTVAVLWLHEPVSTGKIAGAAGVLAGLFLTRLGRTESAVPVEE
jgi:drug/metabolite transporter (DMT)-like permease